MILFCLSGCAGINLKVLGDYSGKAIAVGEFSSKEIRESSGIIESRSFPGVVWTHNDGADNEYDRTKEARIFPVRKDGTVILQAGIKIKNITNHDWEDIAVDDENHLIIGDFGNNYNTREDLALYIVEEPNPYSTKHNEILPISKISFDYPDTSYSLPVIGSFDAEAMFYTNGTVYILTKHWFYKKTRLYKLNGYNLTVSKSTSTLTFIGELRIGGLVTGADISRDGKTLAVLSYNYAILFYTEHPEKEDWLNGKIKGFRLVDKSKEDAWQITECGRIHEKESQYEGICFINNDTELLVSSEDISCEDNNTYQKRKMIKIPISSFISIATSCS